MGYTALYRTFRPKTFSEMVGQEHITRTLKNQIIADRVGHAYLLNGSRGTGKTTTAKVLARAINCLNPKDGEPCNECEICKGAISGSLTDIVEMDAASNNSVEDIRSIREEVNFLPTKAKYRVYIIDEVHMLSTGAFNALLKTLEEPPEHVKFILATTEPQKLPATILSRCQRFDFKKISNKDIIKRLKIVCDESKIEYTEDALNIIAVLSEGAMRDALSILERCVQDGENKIDSEKIKELVGIPKTTHINAIIKAILEYNVEEALDVINNVLEDGKDLINFIWEMIKYSKDILVCKISGTLEIYNDEEKSQIKELAKNTSKDRLVDIIYQLSSLERDLKSSTQKVIMFQAGVIRLCNETVVNNLQNNVTDKAISSDGIKNLEQRITKIENYLRKGVISTRTAPSKTSVASSTTEQTVSRKSTSKGNVSPKSKAVQAKPAKNPENFWPEVLEQLKMNGKMVLASNLAGTSAKEINDLTVGVYFSKPISPFGKTVLEKEENKKTLTDLVSIALGKTMHIKFMENIEKQDNNDEYDIQQIAEGNDIPFNIID